MNDHYLYLFLNLGSITFPFLFSFHPKMQFYKKFPAFLLSISIVAFVFLVWDEFFTEIGVWGFNKAYLLGIFLGSLPLEEVMFFFCIPFASLFINYSLEYFFPDVLLSPKSVKTISVSLFVLVLIVVVFNFPAWYTSVNGILFLMIIAWTLKNQNNYLNRFYISFIFILIPFFIVNGILTGSFITDQVVWYDNQENLGVRLGTIPVEDTFYAFNMLYPVLPLTSYFEKKFNLSRS